MQIQISWLLQKPTDLDLHCLQRHGIYGFSSTRVNKFAPMTRIIIDVMHQAKTKLMQTTNIRSPCKSVLSDKHIKLCILQNISKDSKGPDQTVRMRRLIWGFTARRGFEKTFSLRKTLTGRLTPKHLHHDMRE